ncbi:MAG: NAD(P)H-dependent glycerol-3-phosphate dehydrogenase [Clostridiales Family XIII bacterium]|jgi:glycerol-3-phosphate dehydrogenase (NAD(P)+)|nr:NAD(P)H-dependent glycerol-3-phosphate dehydrogenase [Clostridiales Family XIII bacterium]
MLNVGVIGAGSWGTALSNLLANKGNKVKLWDLDADLLSYIAANRENKKYLAGIELHEYIEISQSDEVASKDVDILLMAVPAQHFRAAFTRIAGNLNPKTVVVNVAKGIEQGALKTISQIAFEVSPHQPYAILSGPSHAEEVGAGMPTTVSVASKVAGTAEFVQDSFITDRFRVYTSSDVLGLELGGALKNIIALGAGISDGMGFGDNTKAALMSRGITEITRLGVKMGALETTFYGLSGIGDLIVTCTSMHSRNRRCGIMIGEGTPPSEATAKVGMVVEGIYTAEAAHDLAKKYDVEMPITESIYQVIQGQMKPSDALDILMNREKKSEQEPI